MTGTPTGPSSSRPDERTRVAVRSEPRCWRPLRFRTGLETDQFSLRRRPTRVCLDNTDPCLTGLPRRGDSIGNNLALRLHRRRVSFRLPTQPVRFCPLLLHPATFRLVSFGGCCEQHPELGDRILRTPRPGFRLTMSASSWHTGYETPDRLAPGAFNVATSATTTKTSSVSPPTSTRHRQGVAPTGNGQPDTRRATSQPSPRPPNLNPSGRRPRRT